MRGPLETMGHEFARRLRRGQTDVERKLWYALRNRQIGALKFCRQQPIGAYIVDFVCFERSLVVELDGSQHGSPENLARDACRTDFLESQGFRVLRFWNHDLNECLEGVVDTIFREAGG